MCIAHRSYTLRRTFSHNTTERRCTRHKCPISYSNLCVVFQIICNNCNQLYIGTTIHFLHDRIREHFSNKNSSMKKHISICQTKDHLKGIEIKTIIQENNPANLRIFYIRKQKPTLNSAEECSKFLDLLF